jgi:hypothetical protein
MKIERSCGMSHVGTHAFTGRIFQLKPVDPAQHVIDRINNCRINPNSSTQRPSASDPIPCSNEQGRPATSSPPRSKQSATQQLPLSATATTWRRVDDAASAKPQEIIDNIIAQGSHSPAHRPDTAVKISRTPSSSPRNAFEQKDKIYCSYWIRSGECDYIQQGCRYKHEMPDKATLASIGFRTVPRWWQEKVAIQLGQSAIPTVGPVMKPEEWLKQRRGSQDSQGSQSDEDSQSEHESEAGEEEGSGVNAASRIVLPQSETVLDPAQGTDEKADVLKLEKIEKSSDEAVKPDPAITATETVNEPHRKLSDVDLIDLSPISPTVSKSSRLDSTITLESNKSTGPCLAKTPTPSFTAPASKQPTISPRKVFVPAGESTEFHVADARKHAPAQKVESEKDSIEAKQCKSTDANTEKRSSTFPATISKRSEPKTGLMGSMHAPQPSRQKLPHCNNASTLSANKSPRPPKATSSPSPKLKEAENGRAKRKATVSSNCSRPASRIAGSPDPMVKKAAAADGRSASMKPARSTGNEPPKSVCRPRRPAVSNNSKAVAARAVTGGTKE